MVWVPQTASRYRATSTELLLECSPTRSSGIWPQIRTAADIHGVQGDAGPAKMDVGPGAPGDTPYGWAFRCGCPGRRRASPQITRSAKSSPKRRRTGWMLPAGGYANPYGDETAMLPAAHATRGRLPRGGRDDKDRLWKSGVVLKYGQVYAALDAEPSRSGASRVFWRPSAGRMTGLR